MTKKMLASGGYDFGGSRLQNAADGISSTDLATVGQLNAATAAAVSNLDFKGSVRVASIGGNITVASPPATLDGVSLVTGNRILLKDQASGAENGIYVYTSSSPLVRATDADANSEVNPGLWVIVEEGTVNADTAWLLTTNAPITVATTVLSFIKYTTGSGGGGATKFAATGPGTAGVTWAITHSLATVDVVVSVREVSTNDEVDLAITHTDANTVTITSASSMAQNAYRAVVIG